jgi:hypothetical protein
VGASFGLNAGLLWLPKFMPEFALATAPNQRDGINPIPWSAAWLIAALGSSAPFIAVLGPGIRF